MTGLTADQIAELSVTEQFDKVIIPYYKATNPNLIRSFTDLCLSTFYPAARGQPDSFTFSPTVVAQNAALFTTGNTLGDYKAYLKKKFPTRFSAVTNKTIQENIIFSSFFAICAGGLGYLAALYKIFK